jgi:hypothetical protein
MPYFTITTVDCAFSKMVSLSQLSGSMYNITVMSAIKATIVTMKRSREQESMKMEVYREGLMC